jgi:DNA transformation protein
VAPEDIRELFSAFGPVEVRRMFGGAGLYAGGTMFAILHDGVIYLKADERGAAAFERENLPPFTYATNDGKRAIMSYRRMPDRLYDDPDELVAWANDALAAARRGRERKTSSGAKARVKAGGKSKRRGSEPKRRS